jgi:hypothetical protein
MAKAYLELYNSAVVEIREFFGLRDFYRSVSCITFPVLLSDDNMWTCAEVKDFHKRMLIYICNSKSCCINVSDSVKRFPILVCLSDCT